MQRTYVCWISKVRWGKINLDIVRERIKKLYHKNVEVHVYGMRNKNHHYYGVVSGIYPYVFTVLVNGKEKSFNYSDVIIGEVVVKLA